MNPKQDIITTLRAQLGEARKTANELVDEKVRLEREIKEAREIAQKYEDRYFGIRDLVSVGTQQAESVRSHMDLCRSITGCPDDETLAVWLEGMMKTRVRLNDPVVKGLVEALEGYTSWTDSASVDFIAAEKALAAYNARLNEITQ